MYEEYALLDYKEKEIKKQKEELRARIIAEMNEKGSQKVSHSLGSFSISKLKKWNYPEYITELADDLKAKKAKAESTGEATYEEEESLRFTSMKV